MLGARDVHPLTYRRVLPLYERQYTLKLVGEESVEIFAFRVSVPFVSQGCAPLFNSESSTIGGGFIIEALRPSFFLVNAPNISTAPSARGCRHRAAIINFFRPMRHYPSLGCGDQPPKWGTLTHFSLAAITCPVLVQYLWI